MSWSHLPSGTWGESETSQAHWNWGRTPEAGNVAKKRHQNVESETNCQSKQLSEPAVVSALSDEGDSGNEHDGNQINSDATVRPVTLPEGWTVVLNSLRQVVYCHVKSGIACSRCPRIPSC